VKRYWQNKAPDWAKDEEEEERDLDHAVKAKITKEVFSAPVVVRKVDDPRLRRLAQSRSAAAGSDDEDAPSVRRRRAAAAVREGRDADDDADGAASSSSGEEAGSGESEEEEDDDDAIAARRAAVKARLREQQEEEVLAQAADEEEEEESSEYETDSEDEVNARQLLKPVFVTKAERETIAERERLEAEEEERAEKEKARLKERRKETRQLVIQRLEQERAEDMATTAAPAGVEDVNTDDEEDAEAEYEAWKVREVARIARDREEKRREAAEAEQRERLKHMTHEERRQWERDNPKVNQARPKQSLKFMQKYWHKGAYYQSAADDAFQHERDDGTDDVYKRDYSAPTGEDKFDKSILPKVMQVKNFGRRGRTKYTHLLDQDTTLFDNPLAPDAAQQQKYENKRAGTEQVFEKPRTYKT